MKMSTWLPKSLQAKKIREIRSRLGMSQEAFVMALGRKSTGQGDVSKWEGGDPPGPKVLARIAGLAGHSVSIFQADVSPSQDEARGLLIAAERLERVVEELRKEAAATRPRVTAEDAAEEPGVAPLTDPSDESQESDDPESGQSPEEPHRRSG